MWSVQIVVDPPFFDDLACVPVAVEQMFVLNQFGDLERSELRPGNIHSADGWRGVIEPVVERYRERDLRRYFRGDSTFASPHIYKFLEVECYKYTIPRNANGNLQKSIA